MGKYEKVCPKLRSMIKCTNCYFCCTNAIFYEYKLYFFGVQYKFFGVQEFFFWDCCRNFCEFAAFWHKFCRLMAHFGRCFAIFWPVLNFLKHSTKVCCIFLGGGCKSLSMDSLMLSKTMQQQSKYFLSCRECLLIIFQVKVQLL